MKNPARKRAKLSSKSAAMGAKPVSRQMEAEIDASLGLKKFQVQLDVVTSEHLDLLAVMYGMPPQAMVRRVLNSFVESEIRYIALMGAAAILKEGRIAAKGAESEPLRSAMKDLKKLERKLKKVARDNSNSF